MNDCYELDVTVEMIMMLMMELMMKFDLLIVSLTELNDLNQGLSSHEVNK